jgi:hypothetical protein
LTIVYVFADTCPEGMSYVSGFAAFFPTPWQVDLSNYNSTGKAKLTYTPANGTVTEGQQLFVDFAQGSGTLYAPTDAKTNEVEVPAGLKGSVYPIVTSVNSIADEHKLLLNLPYHNCPSRRTVRRSLLCNDADIFSPMLTPIYIPVWYLD